MHRGLVSADEATGGADVAAGGADEVAVAGACATTAVLAGAVVVRDAGTEGPGSGGLSQAAKQRGTVRTTKACRTGRAGTRANAAEQCAVRQPTSSAKTAPSKSFDEKGSARRARRALGARTSGTSTGKRVG